MTKIFLFLSTVLFFFAITILPLADSLTLMLLPLFCYFISAIILKEKVGIRRGAAVIIGFIGALIVIRPGFENLILLFWAALGAGLCYALYIISTRKLSTLDHPLVTLIFTGLAGTVLISIVCLLFG
ncbi:MAG: hypothetical protein CM1200mP13_15630 [Candidatus Pelagibacterales bacterium]|nr:MAG: hypothetical protein CM1200mP13_15630 [Pelagibacterales bacterium]